MRCPTCGVDVVEQAVYCHKCGGQLGPAGDDLSGDSRAEQPTPGPAQMIERAASTRPAAQEQSETELWRGGYSSKAMTGAWVASGLISVVLLIVGIFWMPWTALYWLIVLVLMILPWLYYLTVLSYRRMSVRYVLTTQRFVHERGILRRVNDRIEVLDMDDINFEQGLLEQLVGVGTIHIISSDRSHPDLALPGVENVKKVSKLFDDARLAERRRRGLHIEQI